MNTTTAEVAAASPPRSGSGSDRAHLLVQAAAAVARSTSLEELSRPFLDLLHALTGLESTYLTQVRQDDDEQTVLFADNRGSLTIPEGLTLSWQDALCRRALESGRPATSDVEVDLPGSRTARQLGLTTFVTVPVLGPGDELMGTLCGAGAARTTVSPQQVEVMTMLAGLIADRWQRDQLLVSAVRRADVAELRLRERATFLAVAEHRLKSPLALLRGWSEILAESWSELPEEVRTEALQTVQEASKDAVRQVDELLLEARSEVLTNHLEPVPVELGGLVVRVARQLSGAASPGQRVAGQARVEAVVCADREALWQVLWHLGENAVKYSPDGGRIDLVVEELDPSDRGHVVVSVTDEGIGVPTDVDVFAPFTRGTSARHETIAGTGLGLHIVQNLVEAMGGTVTARRRAGVGSEFRVRLPLAT